MKRGWIFWPGVLMLNLVIFPFSAGAHHLLFEETDTKGLDQALEIPEPEISYAIYANLESATDVDYFSFKVKKPMVVYIRMFVPFAPGYENFYPMYALVGPGLGEPKIAHCKIAFVFPQGLPEGYGAMPVINPQAVHPRPVFSEPFSRTKYYKDCVYLQLKVDQPGTYYILVWHPQAEDGKGEPGAYMLSFQKAEKWTLEELIDAFRTMKKIESEWRAKPGPAAKEGRK